jgi:hypothetical protein
VLWDELFDVLEDYEPLIRLRFCTPPPLLVVILPDGKYYVLSRFVLARESQFTLG